MENKFLYVQPSAVANSSKPVMVRKDSLGTCRSPKKKCIFGGKVSNFILWKISLPSVTKIELKRTQRPLFASFIKYVLFLIIYI